MSNTRTTARGGNGKADARAIARLEDEAAEPLDDVVHDAEAAAQAEFEGVPAEQTIRFYGERYRLAPKVPYMPLLRFAHFATRGGNTAEMAAMSAMYDLLRGCFYRSKPCLACEICLGDMDSAPRIKGRPIDCESRELDEWLRFEEHATEVAADDGDLFSVVQAVIEAATSRPTQRRSGSPQPEQRTSPRSKARQPDGAAGLSSIEDLARSQG